MEPSSSPEKSAVAYLLEIVGGAFVFFGVGIPADAYVFNEFTPEKLIVGIVLLIVGSPIAVVGLKWNKVSNALGPRANALFEKAARRQSYWIAFVTLVAAGMAAISAFQVRDILAVQKSQIADLQTNLNCWAAPRRFNDTQKGAVAKYLLSHKAYDANFIIKKNDNEAGDFAGSIMDALRKGNWKITSAAYQDDVIEGFGVTLTSPVPGVTDGSVGGNLNPKSPDTILNAAFESAGFPADHGGSGYSKDAIKATVTIDVGPRRADEYGPYCPQHKTMDVIGPPVPR